MSENESLMPESTSNRTNYEPSPMSSAAREDGFCVGDLPDFDSAHDAPFDNDLSNIHPEEPLEEHE